MELLSEPNTPILGLRCSQENMELRTSKYQTVTELLWLVFFHRQNMPAQSNWQ
jgi:hypothetical protein